MEIYHQCGVEGAIRAAGLPHHHTGLIVWAKTLAGEEIERRVPWRARAQSGVVSPVRNCLCAQDDLEPVLRWFAEKQGGGKLAFRPRRSRSNNERMGSSSRFLTVPAAKSGTCAPPM